MTRNWDGFTAPFLLSHVDHVGDECLIWPFGRDSAGYGRAKVPHFRTRLAHRIMCELVNGPAPFEGAVARHTCGNGHGGCVHPAHLAWGSAAENSNDQLAHGTRSFGEHTTKAVLKADQILRVRHLYSEGWSQRKISAEFDVHHTTIQAIIERRTWGHIE